MAEIKENDKYLHTDGSIHVVNYIEREGGGGEGAVAFVQVYTDGTLSAEYSTDIQNYTWQDPFLAGSLAPVVK
jgi:hypothetical protein